MQQSFGAAGFRRGAGNTAQQSLPQPLLAAGSPRPQAAYFEAAPVCVRDTVIVERNYTPAGCSRVRMVDCLRGTPGRSPAIYKKQNDPSGTTTPLCVQIRSWLTATGLLPTSQVRHRRRFELHHLSPEGGPVHSIAVECSCFECSRGTPSVCSAIYKEPRALHF